MTEVKITVDRATATAKMSGILTSGMVGVKVDFSYSDVWNGLNKTAVFTAGKVTRDVLNADGTVEVPPEVLQKPGEKLYVGVYGTNGDGTLVIPTVRAYVGIIMQGSDPSGDESTSPELPVWAQLQNEVNELKESGAGGSGKPGEDGGYYTPSVSRLDENTVQFQFTPSKSGMPAVPPALVELPGGGNDSGQNPTVSSGDIASIKTILGNLMTIIGAQVEDEDGTPQGYSMDVSGLVTQNNTLIAALGTSDDTGGGSEDDGGDSGGGDAGTTDGVTSISHTVTAYDISDEPENGYMIITDTAHTAYNGSRPIPAWPLVSGKTYSITVSSLGENETGGTTNYFGLWVSALNIVPVKGEVNDVTDTIVKNLDAWTGTATTKTYSYTAGDNEYLIFHANVLNLLRITAEVTA